MVNYWNLMRRNSIKQFRQTKGWWITISGKKKKNRSLSKRQHKITSRDKKIRFSAQSAIGGTCDSDETFAFIAGYTEGGAPYGITWEEAARLEAGHCDLHQQDGEDLDVWSPEWPLKSNPGLQRMVEESRKKYKQGSGMSTFDLLKSLSPKDFK
jgi:hypothetical protein